MNLGELAFASAFNGEAPKEQKPWKWPFAAKIEADYATWLRAVAPKTYAGDFEPFHASFWEWWHETLQVRAKGGDLSKCKLDGILAMGRGLGKSASMEGAVIMAGAMLGPILTVYVSSTQDKASEHLQSIRSIIEGSSLAKYYPGLSNPRVGEFGNQRGWKAEAIFTDSGFAVVCASLEKGIRGLRDEERRPLILVFDDIDERDDSPKIKKEKFDTLRLDAMPMLAPFGSVLFGQNLIYSGSIMQETWDGKLDWFYNAHRVGVINTFQDDLDIQKVDGKPTIVAGTPNWNRIGRAEAQDMLGRFGEDAFMRECQNNTRPNQEELVWKHWDESVHVITWDDFELFFGMRKIPRRWALHFGYDRGYTGWDKHPSVAMVAAVASVETPLAGDVFLFYERVTSPQEGVNEIARDLIQGMAEMVDEPNYERAWQMVKASDEVETPEQRAKELRQDAGALLRFHTAFGSHEGKHERDTFASDWGLGVETGDANKTAGLAQLWNYLQPESRQHPFYLHLQKKPNVYVIVDPAQKKVAKDARGMKRLRQEAGNLTFDPNVTTRDVPTKFGDDATDACKHIFSTFSLTMGERTPDEEVERRLPEEMKRDNVRQFLADNQMGGFIALRQKVQKIVREEGIEAPDGTYDRARTRSRDFRNRFGR